VRQVAKLVLQRLKQGDDVASACSDFLDYNICWCYEIGFGVAVTGHILLFFLHTDDTDLTDSH